MIGIDTTDYDKSVSTDEVKHKPQVGDVRYLWSSADRAPEGLLRATILSIEDDGRLSCRLDLLTAHVDLDPAEWASGGGTGYRRPLPREDGALTIGEALHLLKDLPDDQVSYLRPDFGCSYRGDAPSLGIIEKPHESEVRGTVGALRAFLRGELGAEQPGWKGGEYVTDELSHIYTTGHPGDTGEPLTRARLLALVTL